MDVLTSKKFFVVLGIILIVSLVFIAGLFGWQIFTLNQIVGQTQSNVKTVNQNGISFQNEVKDQILAVSEFPSTSSYQDYKSKLEGKISTSTKFIETSTKAKNSLLSGANVDNQKIFTQANSVLSQRLDYLKAIANYLNLNMCLADKAISLADGSSDLGQKWSALPQTVSKEEIASLSDTTSKAINAKTTNLKDFKACFEENLNELATNADIDLAIKKETDLYTNLAGQLDKLSSSIKTNTSVDYQTAVTALSKTFENKSELLKSLSSVVINSLQKDLGKLEEILKNEEGNFITLVQSYKDKYNYQGKLRFF